MIQGHRLEEVVEAGLAPSVRWLQDQIRAGRIRAHKPGRHWILTDDDLELALATWESKPLQSTPATLPTAPPIPLSLTTTSLRRQKAAS